MALAHCGLPRCLSLPVAGSRKCRWKSAAMRACSSRYVLRFLRPAQNLRRARDGQRAQRPGGGGRKLRRSEPRRAGRLAVAVVIPVAQAAGRKAVLGLRLDVVGEAAHHVEVVAQHLRVAAPLVLLPGQQHRRRAPFDRPVERAGKPACRIAGRDRQHPPARLLRIADVPQDLVEPVAAVVAILEARREQVGTFEPAEFLAVRDSRTARGWCWTASPSRSAGACG